MILNVVKLQDTLHLLLQSSALEIDDLFLGNDAIINLPSM